MSLNVQAPINSVSFGFVSYHLLRQFWRKGINVNWAPIGGNADISSFNKIEPEFQQWLQSAANKANASYKRTDPTFRLWHINGSQESMGAEQNLLTFHETDQLHPVEVNILNNQKNVFVTSMESKQVFEQCGVTTPVHYVPLGYDTDHFYDLKRRAYPEGVTCWLLSAKAEYRKSTLEVIQLWIKRFGGNREHVLHLAVTNPFFKPEDNAAFLNQAFQGDKPFNVVVLPYTKTLGELNDIYNSADIVIDMSKAEAWSLPSFHTLGLGKHAIIHNATAMKGWANADNAVLVEPVGKVKAIDNIFFHEGSQFNVGNFYAWKPEDLTAAFDTVMERLKANRVNTAGLELQTRFTWEATASKILDVIQKG